MATRRQSHSQQRVEEQLQEFEQNIARLDNIFSSAKLDTMDFDVRITLLTKEKPERLGQQTSVEEYAATTRTGLNRSWYRYLSEAQTSDRGAVIEALRKFLVLERKLEQIEHNIREYLAHDGAPAPCTLTGKVDAGLEALPGDAASPTTNGLPRALQELAGAGDPAQTFTEIAPRFWERIATGGTQTVTEVEPPGEPPARPDRDEPSARPDRIVVIVALVLTAVLAVCAVLWLSNTPIAPNRSATAIASIVGATPPATVAPIAVATPPAAAASSVETRVPAPSITSTEPPTQPTPAVPTHTPSASQTESTPSATLGTEPSAQPTALVLTIQGVHEAYVYTNRIALDQFGPYTRLRSEPRADSSRGAYLRNMDQVQVLEANDSWYYIRIIQNGDGALVGQEGWIERWLVDNTNVPPPPTPVPLVVIPDVHGADVGKARAFLQQQGFRVVVSVLPSDQVGALCNGWVSYSAPRAGLRVPRGSSVRLYYRGFDVPNPPGCG